MDHHSTTAEPTTDSGSALTTAPARTTTRRRLRRTTGATLAGAALLAVLPGSAQAKIDSGSDTAAFEASFVCDRGTVETDDDFTMTNSGVMDFTFKVKASNAAPDGELYSETGTITQRLSAPELGVSFTVETPKYTLSSVRVVSREGSLVTIRLVDRTRQYVHAPDGTVDARLNYHLAFDLVLDESKPRGERFVSQTLAKAGGQLPTSDPCSDAIRFAAAG